jgi:predicted thioesterase
LIFSYAVRAYQSDQELGKKQKQKYFVDKNKIRAKIEERKRKIDEKNQVLQEAVK